MPITAILGLQWGDEGKAKIVDYETENADYVVRFQGGANAGHTVEVGDKKYVFHLVPSGIIRPGVKCALGNGVLIDPGAFLKELEALGNEGINFENRLFISPRAHVVFPFYKYLDGLLEEDNSKEKIGSTKRGMGPGYKAKASRVGICVGELQDWNYFRKRFKLLLNDFEAQIKALGVDNPFDGWEVFEDYYDFGKQLAPYIKDVGIMLQQAYKEGKHILMEGAQGTMLDLDHGTYPYVTSSNVVAPNMFTGSGFYPNEGEKIRIIGIMKSYCTRIGTGPFPTEFDDDFDNYVREKGKEYGATTGRPRRCGWLDLTQILYSIRVSGITEFALMKLDVLSGLKKIKVGIGYQGLNTNEAYPMTHELLDCSPTYVEFAGWDEDITECKTYGELPEQAKFFVEEVEKIVNIPITTVSVGPKRSQTIKR